MTTTLPTATFSLNALIRRVAFSASSANVEKVADEVMRLIPVEDRDEALRQALTTVVRHELCTTRRSTTLAVGNAAGHGETTGPIPHGHRPQRPGRSWKRDGIREYWRKALTEKYSIDRNGNTVALADLTREQVLFNIAAREKLAATTAARALQLRGVLELMERHDVARVGDLPESVLAAILVPVS